jgi:hypothetical protein
VSYATPAAFKQALEARLRAEAAATRRDLARVRQLLVFERFLSRVFAAFGDNVVLKGGVVLELRLARARTTRDIDLRASGDPEKMLARLREAGALVNGDWLQFLVRPDATHPEMKGEGVVYDGRRFRVEAQLAGRLYGSAFGVDVAMGDPIHGAVEEIHGSDRLAFIGAPRPAFRVYPRETHIAEKLHAFTLPRVGENTRVKDLPDLALLAQTAPFRADTIRAAVRTTFDFRGTHPVPVALPSTPAAWSPVYERIARVDDLPWKSLDELSDAVRAFLDPVLATMPHAIEWSPTEWAWRAG